MTAVEKVLSIPELLEQILLQLPLRQLLFARKVSKTFDSTINDSPQIRKALFLSSGAGKPLTWHPNTMAAGPGDASDDSGWRNPGQEPEDSVKPVLNPFPAISRGFSGFPSQPWYHQARRGMAVRRSGLYLKRDETLAFSGWIHPCHNFTVKGPWKSVQELEEMMAHTGGNFQRMLLTYPPVQSLTISVLRKEAQEYSAVDEQAGMKFGELVMHSAGHLAKHDGGTTWVVVEGGESWQVLKRSVDEVTGWEMLWMLDSQNEELEGVFGQ